MITYFNGLGLVIGLQIGSGIFSTPGLVAAVGSPGGALLIWLVAGLLAWTGATSYAELGVLIPSNGGTYAYLQHFFGDLPAFLYSFAGILVLKPGSAAIIAIITAEYLGGPTKYVAVLVVITVNCIISISTKMATRVNDVLTVLKVITLLLIVGSGWGSHSITFTTPHNVPAAIYSAVWAFDGWDNCSYIAREMENPRRDIPKVVHTAMPLVISLYILTNLAYFKRLPFDAILHTHTVALDYGNLFSIGWLVSVAVISSSFGALLSSSITSARLIAVIPRLSYIHPHAETPVLAICAQTLLTILYVVFGDFEHLIATYGIIAWTFFLVTVAALLHHRFNIISLIFCICATALLIFGILSNPWSVLGLLILPLGCAAYYIYLKLP